MKDGHTIWIECRSIYGFLRWCGTEWSLQVERVMHFPSRKAAEKELSTLSHPRGAIKAPFIMGKD